LCTFAFRIDAISFAADASAGQMTRDIKVISSAGARAMADACIAWAEQNKQIVAMAILDWGRQSHRVARHGRRSRKLDRHRAVEGQVGAALAAADLGDQQGSSGAAKIWRRPS